MYTIMATLDDAITGLNTLTGHVASVSDMLGNVEKSTTVQDQ